MHSIVLLTAMTATSGLFGGRPAKMGHQAAYSRPVQVAAAPCRTGTCGGSYAPAATYAPAAPAYAPAPQTATVPATAYSSYYYPAASCATGNCPRR